MEVLLKDDGMINLHLITLKIVKGEASVCKRDASQKVPSAQLVLRYCPDGKLRAVSVWHFHLEVPSPLASNHQSLVYLAAI